VREQRVHSIDELEQEFRAADPRIQTIDEQQQKKQELQDKLNKA